MYIPYTPAPIIQYIANDNSNPSRFVRNIDYLILDKLQGTSNKKEGDIIRDINEVITVNTGEAIFISNNNSLVITAYANTSFYIKSIDTRNKIFTLYIESGYLNIKLNNQQDDTIYIHTPGSHAAVRGTIVNVAVNPNRVTFSSIENNIEINDNNLLPQGYSLIDYDNGESIELETKEDFSISILEFLFINQSLYSLKGKTNPLNNLIINGQYVSIDNKGYFDTNISLNDNILLITPTGVQVKYKVTSRGII